MHITQLIEIIHVILGFFISGTYKKLYLIGNHEDWKDRIVTGPWKKGDAWGWK